MKAEDLKRKVQAGEDPSITPEEDSGEDVTVTGEDMMESTEAEAKPGHRRPRAKEVSQMAEEISPKMLRETPQMASLRKVAILLTGLIRMTENRPGESAKRKKKKRILVMKK